MVRVSTRAVLGMIKRLGCFYPQARREEERGYRHDCTELQAPLQRIRGVYRSKECDTATGILTHVKEQQTWWSMTRLFTCSRKVTGPQVSGLLSSMWSRTHWLLRNHETFFLKKTFLPNRNLILIIRNFLCAPSRSSICRKPSHGKTEAMIGNLSSRQK